MLRSSMKQINKFENNNVHVKQGSSTFNRWGPLQKHFVVRGHQFKHKYIQQTLNYPAKWSNMNYNMSQIDLFCDIHCILSHKNINGCICNHQIAGKLTFFLLWKSLERNYWSPKEALCWVLTKSYICHHKDTSCTILHTMLSQFFCLAMLKGDSICSKTEMSAAYLTRAKTVQFQRDSVGFYRRDAFRPGFAVRIWVEASCDWVAGVLRLFECNVKWFTKKKNSWNKRQINTYLSIQPVFVFF